MVQTAPHLSDCSEALLGILTRYVSPPTAQSIVKLARQRANIITPRLDRAQLGDMFAPIARNLRLFVSEPSKVDECCAAIQALIGGRPAGAEPASVRSAPPSSARSSGPSSVRSPPAASAQSSEPASARSPAPSSVRSPEPPSVRPAHLASARPSEASSARSAAPARPAIPSSLVQIRLEDDIARARSEARDLASAMGFSVVGRTRLVTAVSELARNIVLYAREGQVELSPAASPAGISVVASDQGPGIPNLEQIMVGEYKSRLGMGLGLRGVKRLADRFDIQTSVGQGTTVSFFVKVI